MYNTRHAAEACCLSRKIRYAAREIFFFLIFRIFQRFATATRKDRTFPVAQASPKPKSFVLFLRFAVVWRRILIPRNFLPAQKPEKRKTSIKTQHV